MFGKVFASAGRVAGRVADKATPGLELRLVREVLKLTATAFVGDVVRTPRLDSDRRRLEHAAGPRPREAPVLAKAVELDEIAGRGARNEHRPSVGQTADPVSAGGEAQDSYGCRYGTAAGEVVHAHRRRT